MHKNTESTTTTIRQNVLNEDENPTIVTVGDNITFVQSSKKRKIDDTAKITKQSSSFISGLEFVEEMGLIT